MSYAFSNNGMMDAAAWTPVQEAGEFFDGIKESPCRGCRHIRMDKSVCRTFPECPIRIKTMIPKSGYQDRENASGTGICQWPGCKNPVKRGKYCMEGGHSRTVSQRKRLYPNFRKKWFEPVRPRGKRR